MILMESARDRCSKSACASCHWQAVHVMHLPAPWRRQHLLAIRTGQCGCSRCSSHGQSPGRDCACFMIKQFSTLLAILTLDVAAGVQAISCSSELLSTHSLLLSGQSTAVNR